MDASPSKRQVSRTTAALSLLCAALATLVGCRKPAVSDRSYMPESKEFGCEIPLDWIHAEKTINDPYLLDIASPDHVGEVAASIGISQESKKTRKELEEYMAGLRERGARRPNFSLDPLTTIRVGEFTGLTYSMTTTRHAEYHHRPITPPPPHPVPYKETFVYFDTPGGTYQIEYAAPTAIYEKYRPAFERVLKTFRWTKPAGKGSK